MPSKVKCEVALKNVENVEHEDVKVYPVNTLRNIARRGSHTDFQLLSDMENFVSTDACNVLRNILHEVHGKAKQKAVIIVRRFESNSSFPIPLSMQELSSDLFENVFPFHYFYFPLGHFIPDLKEWMNISKDKSRVYLQKIPYLGAFWEPELVLHKSDPLHFEELLMRHRDQAALSYELCRADYSFLVASHVFSVHEGIKLSLSKKETEDKDLFLSKGISVMKQFYSHLNNRYPETEGKCLGYPEKMTLLDLPFFT